MAEVLTQNEIDELLSALSSGDINVSEIQDHAEEKKVKVYDFRRPDKFAKDHLRTLEVIYENYSRLMVSYLSGILRSFCEVEVTSVEPQTYHEFINSLPDPVVLGIADFRPLNGSLILEISPDIAYAIIDKMLGGSGNTTDNKRDFTEIEITLIRRVINQLLSLMNEPWDNVIQTDFKLERIETTPQFAQIISPNETIAIITMNIKIGEIEGLINICIPHMVVEPIIDQLSTRYWFSSNKGVDRQNDQAILLAKKIEDTFIGLSAVLGVTKISVKEFISLQIGDVIKLNNSAKENISLIVGGKKKFSATIGVKNKKYAVKITKKEGGIFKNYE